MNVDIGQQADSVEEWMDLVKQCQIAADQLLLNDATAHMSWHFIGFAAECAVKAAIMRQNRFNSWPSREARPDVHVHSLKALAKAANIVILPTDAVAPFWQVALSWQRQHMYYPKGAPLVVTRQIYEAVFDEQEGVVAWISRRYL